MFDLRNSAFCLNTVNDVLLQLM